MVTLHSNESGSFSPKIDTNTHSLSFLAVRHVAPASLILVMSLRFIMLGDIVGKPGRRVVQQHIGALRREYEADLVIANGENVAGGSGMTTQLFNKLIKYGIDGVTLGDHVYRQRDIYPALDAAPNLIRPANFPEQAVGRGAMVLHNEDESKSLLTMIVLGRIYMPGQKADDPFVTIQRILDAHPDHTHTFVEVHAETTAEKAAIAHYFDGRVSAVLGSHTHIPTADAKILPGGTAFLTDLGMCGPYDSVLGRRKDRVVQFMSTAMPAAFDVAEDDIRLCGAFVELDDSGRAIHIERIERAADPDRAPFSQTND